MFGESPSLDGVGAQQLEVLGEVLVRFERRPAMAYGGRRRSGHLGRIEILNSYERLRAWQFILIQQRA